MVVCGSSPGPVNDDRQPHPMRAGRLAGRLAMAAKPGGSSDESWEYSLRMYLLLLATMVATVTYGAGFIPPGGVWQSADPAAHRIAGDPIIRDTNRARYLAFFYCNSTAFASSLVVIVLVLSLSVQHDSGEAIPLAPPLAVLRAVMVLDLLSLMGAYAAGAFRDTFTAVYSLVLSAGVVGYLVAHFVLASWPSPAVEDRRGQSLPERRRKVLMLLATFAASVTYVAGLSAPGGFWDHREDGHLPGDAILKGGPHDARLKAFFVCNTTAFVASLLILVMLMEKKLCFSQKVHSYEIYGFIAFTLIGLLAAYAAGGSRQIDTTIYVSALVDAVVTMSILVLVVLVSLFQQANSSHRQPLNGSNEHQQAQGPQTRNDNNDSDEIEQQQQTSDGNVRDRISQLLALALDRAHMTKLWVVNFWRARMHRRDRLVKWGPHEWVLDSGAWIHRTSNPLALDADEDDYMYAQLGLRSVRTERFDFPGVQYVAGNDDDDDRRNVVSVSQLARDHGLVTVFEPTSCHVKEKKTGQIVGKGRLRNGMYMLDYLRVVGQYIGDGGASSGGKHNDRGSGSRGHEGRGNTNNGKGGPSRGFSGGGTGASRNPEQGDSGSRANGGDINDEEIVNEEEEGGSENEVQEMNDENIEEDDIGRTHQEINGNGEEEEDKKRGRSTFGESSNKARTNLLFGLSRFVLVLCLCIAACISLLQCMSWGTGVICKLATFNNLDLDSLLVFLFLFISSFQLLRTLSTMQFTSCNKLVKQIGYLFRRKGTDKEDKEGTSGDYIQESSQEHNRRLFGLSRFDAATDIDPTRYCRRQLPAGAFPSSTNTARREEFLVDSGASFHATWREPILFSYPLYLQDHTRPPTRYFGGIVGRIEVTRSGYLNGDKIMLDGVLLARESRMNLVSVGQLSVQYGAQVEMDDETVTIKRKQDGVRIGGGKMLNNHQYVLEYFDPPGGLFAHGPTPNFKIFGTRRPGRPQ